MAFGVIKKYIPDFVSPTTLSELQMLARIGNGQTKLIEVQFINEFHAKDKCANSLKLFFRDPLIADTDLLQYNFSSNHSYETKQSLAFILNSIYEKIEDFTGMPIDELTRGEFYHIPDHGTGSGSTPTDILVEQIRIENSK